jgi:hypothetical protein
MGITPVYVVQVFTQRCVMYTTFCYVFNTFIDGYTGRNQPYRWIVLIQKETMYPEGKMHILVVSEVDDQRPNLQKGVSFRGR